MHVLYNMYMRTYMYVHAGWSNVLRVVIGVSKIEALFQCAE